MEETSSDMKHIASVFSCSIGNILEWYDFGLFTIFSSLFSHLFFPTSNTHLALLATISIFSIGFFCRPLGALLFGYIGDKQGRAKTIRLSILMITLPTLIIAFLPSYQKIGIIAPILLILVRMWQGISIGGEYSGNMIYLAETAPPAYQATVTSFASIGANSGILLASLVGIMTHYLNPHALQTWGWRVCYLISGLICLIIYCFRLQIQETAIFEQLKKEKKIINNPIKFVFKNHFLLLLRTLGLVCMGSTFYFFCFVYLPLFFIQHLSLPIFKVSLLMSTLMIIMIFIVPIAGLICDHVGRRKMLLFNATLITVSIVPGFYFLQWQPIILLTVILLLFTIASALEQGVTPITLIENFPAATRYTGISLGYNIGSGFLGGTIPFICEWLWIHLSPLAPALYVGSCALITGIVAFFFIPKCKKNQIQHFENGVEEDRTPDLRIANATLSQLSYDPKKEV